MRKLVAVVAALFVLAGGPAGAQPSSAAVGVPNPESSYFDPGTGSWFISSIGLAPDAEGKNGDGAIHRLDATGDLIALPWVSGLDSPKGMRSHDGVLYVADIDTLVLIDIATATITDRVVMSEAVLLNDVAVDEATGDVYVTDWLGEKVFRVSDGGYEVFLDTPDLEAPNGIIVEGGALVLAAWGTNVDPEAGFATDEPGRILRVDLGTKAITAVSGRIGNLDGIERVGDHYLVTDWTGGRLLRVDSDGNAETLWQLLPSSADLGYDPETQTVGIPVTLGQTVVFGQI